MGKTPALAQKSAYRAGVVKQPQLGKRQHISGHGQGQHQPPKEKAAQREVIQGSEPSGGGAQHGYPHAHAQQQYQRILQQQRQLEFEQKRPNFGIKIAHRGHNHRQGQHQGRHTQRQPQAWQQHFHVYIPFKTARQKGVLCGKLIEM